MWISYAGRDSGELVDALDRQLKTQYPALQVYRYKKRVELTEQLSEADKAETGPRANDEWPVVEQPTASAVAQDQFHLLPLEDLFELVLEIAFASRVLVILSPAYFRSLPCLQELAALMCRKGPPYPMFVLNGVTHAQIDQGQILIRDGNSASEVTVDMAAALAEARLRLSGLNAFNFTETLSKSDAADYLQRLVNKHVPEVSDNTAEWGPMADCLIESSVSEEDARNIASAVEACFLQHPDTHNFHQRLRDADRQRYIRWFGYDFAKQLLETLQQINPHANAEYVIDQISAAPAHMDRDLSSALRSMHVSRHNTEYERERWKAGISELAGLYALTLIDYDTLVTLGELSRAHDLLYLRFFSGEFTTTLRASIVNATLRDSMLRLMPSSVEDGSGELTAPGFSLSEPDSTATANNSHAAREFVETLHAWILQKSRDLCPLDNPRHPTGMSERERQRLRGRIKKYQANHGTGSLVLIIEKRRFSTGCCWWELWDEVHSALNDGALPHSRVMLQGIVATEHDSGASITMHPDHEVRLIYIEDLLQNFYWI